MLKVNGLTKNYPSFSLKNVSFEVPKGYITGFIGMNGAGKTTTLKSIMNIIHPDGGEINIFGKNVIGHEEEIKQDVAFMLGAVDYYPKTKIKTIASVRKRFYRAWDEARYRELLRKFSIDENKKVTELSMGMKVKLGIAFALSHNAKLIIFDEPTNGLDPIARDELLDLFQELVENGERSILFSTHITSDLDKCADYILFIKDGSLIANDTKDNILASHRIVTGGLNDLTPQREEMLIGIKKHRFGFTGLIKTVDEKAFVGMEIATPNLEDIMVYYNRHGVKEDVL